jgi:GAF domain-containing protein
MRVEREASVDSRQPAPSRCFPAMSDLVDRRAVWRLFGVARGLVGELDEGVVFDRILEAARELTGARYAALGVLNEQHTELERFHAAGLDSATRAAIGELPHGRGVLGVLINDPQPLRLRDVGGHPSSYGFPEAHPVMHSFLGVPISIRGEVWGNLYLAEKHTGEFTKTDQEVAVMLADWAATTIDIARLYQTSERRREELEQAARGLEATRDIATAIGGSANLTRALELIAKHGRALIDADSLLVILREGVELVVAASAGQPLDVHGLRLPIHLASGQPRARSEQTADLTARLRAALAELGVPDPHAALLVPMFHLRDTVGVLAAFDGGEQPGAFTAQDEQLLSTFAATAANALTMIQSVESDRLHNSIARAGARRGHRDSELHDEPPQRPPAVRELLSAPLLRGDAQENETAMGTATDQLETATQNLHAISAELSPAALDEFARCPASETPLERRHDGDVDIVDGFEMPEAGPRRPTKAAVPPPNPAVQLRAGRADRLDARRESGIG